MAKAKIQSLSRAFKRGNAILEFNSVTKTVVAVYKKRENHNSFLGWKNRVKQNALVADMNDYCENVANYAKKQALQNN